MKNFTAIFDLDGRKEEYNFDAYSISVAIEEAIATANALGAEVDEIIEN